MKRIHDPETSLVAAIIAQGVEDYRAMESSSWIAGGKVILPNCTNRAAARQAKEKRTRGYRGFRHQAEELVQFFKPGQGMDRLLHIGGIKISGNAIRAKLGVVG